LVTLEASHLPLDPAPAIARSNERLGRSLEGRADLGSGAREMGKAMAKGEMRACEGDERLSSFLWAVKPTVPLLRRGPRHFPM
jgi:hypothetical protein